jgi:hypothetical protein
VLRLLNVALYVLRQHLRFSHYLQEYFALVDLQGISLSGKDGI